MKTSNNICSCGRPAEVSAPAGWDMKNNRPHSIPMCCRCAAQDGWPWLDEADYCVVQPVTGARIPYGDWAPGGKELDELEKLV